MQPWRRRYDAVVVFMLLGLLAACRQSQGQTAERIGTILVVENVAEVRAQNATTWERLRFRDAVLVNDTVRTAAASKVKILLRDDSIMTLGEHSEMQLTTFLLSREQRRTVVNLVLGTLRVITTRIFGADSATEVHTLNTVAGIRGTDLVVSFSPPDHTDVMVRATETEVTVQNPNFPLQAVALTANFQTRVEGNAPPPAPIPIPTDTLQGTMREVSTPPPQIPAAVQVTQELAPPDTPRGAEQTPLSPSLPPPSVPTFPVHLAQEAVNERVEDPPLFAPSTGVPSLNSDLQELQTLITTPDSGNAATAEIIERGTTDVTIIIPLPR